VWGQSLPRRLHAPGCIWYYSGADRQLLSSVKGSVLGHVSHVLVDCRGEASRGADAATAIASVPGSCFWSDV
jgi:hypothetical protein